MNIETENPTENLKLYSQKSIGVATFIGGPMAAGYLIMKNYSALSKPDEGKRAFIIGILSTIIVFGGIFMVPDNIIDAVPNQLIPLVYTGIIYLIVESIQGTDLKLHKENANEFISAWKAAGVGFISLLAISAIILGIIFYGPSSVVYDEYDEKFEEFYENERESLIFYQDISMESRDTLISKLDKDIIPKWERNIAIIEESNRTKDLPVDLLKRNSVLMDYAQLRIKAFRLFRKSILKDTDDYMPELERIHDDIDKKLNELEQLSVI